MLKKKSSFLYFLLAILFLCVHCQQGTKYGAIEAFLNPLLQQQQIVYRGTLQQFLMEPQSLDPSLSSIPSIEFIDSQTYPVLLTLFTEASLKITGFVPPAKESLIPLDNTPLSNATESPYPIFESYYRGYIETPTGHYEGIFKIQTKEDPVIFSICAFQLKEEGNP